MRESISSDVGSAGLPYLPGGSAMALAAHLLSHLREGRMLHKTSKVLGFHLVATDGEIGHVDDFLVDENWGVRYLVIDTSNWIGGKSVLISPAAIEKVD